MHVKDYNYLLSIIPQVDIKKVKDYYNFALNREGNINKILLINWNDIDIEVDFDTEYCLRIVIEDCGVVTNENGAEELGEITLGWSKITQQWTLLM